MKLSRLKKKSGNEKSSKDYRRIKKYDVINIGGVKKLILPLSEANKDIKYYVRDEEIFYLIHEEHSGCGHGGRDRTEKAVFQKYANITRCEVQMYLDLCIICEQKRSQKKKGIVVKPLLYNEINERAQVDLIDMQTCPDGEYKFIMTYQDHLTKYVVLRPLKSKSASAVAYELLDIFCNYSAPSVLQSDNGREFVNKIIDELKILYPNLVIVHGKPRHSQSQGSVERANQDVQNILNAWMKENATTGWSQGLRFCQIQKNSAHHSAIKQSPFEAMFGK